MESSIEKARVALHEVIDNSFKSLMDKSLDEIKNKSFQELICSSLYEVIDSSFKQAIDDSIHDTIDKQLNEILSSFTKFKAENVDKTPTQLTEELRLLKLDNEKHPVAKFNEINFALKALGKPCLNYDVKIFTKTTEPYSPHNPGQQAHGTNLDKTPARTFVYNTNGKKREAKAEIYRLLLEDDGYYPNKQLL